MTDFAVVETIRLWKRFLGNHLTELKLSQDR
jgi:hypothetical protein